MVQEIAGLSSLMGQYDALILDLWGVIHDGEQLYPGVRECLVELNKAGKAVQFLSNAPRKAANTSAVLDRMGIEQNLYDRILTSGQLAFEWLRDGSINTVKGTHALFIGPERDRHVMEGTDITETSVEKADFVLNAGLDDNDLVVDHYVPQLEAAAKRKLPMLCINPDREVIKQNGFIWPCAGWLAEIYEQMNGHVTYIGKPYPGVYADCLAYWPRHEKKRILAVGDNLSTDIRGANAAGIDSLLIAGGVMKIACGLADTDEIPSLTELEPYMRSHKAWPAYIAPRFNW
ncbi:TIGR01459 family HAD-type hydrolase [bacterium]|nr:TIGR01459 family HAD-type hydrolase [bacterium]